MREENNEIIEEKDEVVEEVEEVKDEPAKKKKKKSNIIIPILAAVVAFAIVYGGITLFEHFTAKDDVVEKNEDKEEVKDEEKDENTDVEEDNSSVEDNGGQGGTTAPDEVITITEDMRNELNLIANIGKGYCYVQKLFYGMNGSTKDLTLENKKYIVMSYHVLANPGSDRISEASFKQIAAKYSFTESFDTVMAGFEKVGNEYVIPPMGCVGPERITNNPVYEDTGNTITVTDNVSITNTETNEVKNIKVIYTFVYSKNGDNISFRLEQVNSVNQ